MIYHDHRRPKDRLHRDRWGRTTTTPSERYWQGGWIAHGHEITAYVDLHLTERLGIERPVVRER